MEPHDEAAFTSAADRRGVTWSLASTGLNAFFAIFTFGGSVFVLFLNQLGLSKSRIGALLSLFPFCGVLALFVAPWVARIGRKRVFLAFYGLRKFVIALLLAVPFVLARFGSDAATWFVSATILAFAVCRAIAETAYYPWCQEFIPDAVRGRYSAGIIILSTLASCLAVAVAAWVLGTGDGLGRFLWLIGVGAAIGVVSVILMAPVPGGAPVPAPAGEGRHWAALRDALRDRNFCACLGGLGLITLGSGLVTAFLPLFLKEQVGLNARQVVSMDMATLVGGVVSGLAWGWSSDRHGSRPVVVFSQSLALAVILGWVLLPRHHEWRLGLAAGLCFAGGALASGHAIASSRWLFSSVIPQEKNTEYSAIFYAWYGVTGGLGPVLAGYLLNRFAAATGAVAGVAWDGYAFLFLAAIVMTFAGIQLYRRVAPDGPFTTRQLATAAFVALRSRFPLPW